MRAIILIIFAVLMMGTAKAQQERLSIKDSLKHVEKMAKIEAELEIARINADKPIVESPGVTVGFGGGYFNPFFNSFYNRPFYNNGFYNNGYYRNSRPIIIKRRRNNGNRNINTRRRSYRSNNSSSIRRNNGKPHRTKSYKQPQRRTVRKRRN